MSIFKRKKKEDKKDEKPKEDGKGLDSSKGQESKPSTTLRPGKTKKPATSGKKELKKFEGMHGVLVKPLVTEKISEAGMYNQYAFEVSPRANKIEVKKAVETYYHVKPIGVNIINVRGKQVRWGRTRGKTKGWKKAIVTLRSGDRIELYEGV